MPVLPAAGVTSAATRGAEASRVAAAGASAPAAGGTSAAGRAPSAESPAAAVARRRAAAADGRPDHAADEAAGEGVPAGGTGGAVRALLTLATGALALVLGVADVGLGLLVRRVR